MDKAGRPSSLRIPNHSATASRQLPNVPRSTTNNKNSRNRFSSSISVVEEGQTRERQGSIPTFSTTGHSISSESVRASGSSIPAWGAPRKPNKAPPPPPSSAKPNRELTPQTTPQIQSGSSRLSRTIETPITDTPDSTNKSPRLNRTYDSPRLQVVPPESVKKESPRTLPSVPTDGASPIVARRPLPDPKKFRPTIDYGGGMIPQEPHIVHDEEWTPKLTSKYSILDPLGSGGYAKVYLVTDKKKKKYALKVIDKEVTAQASGEKDQIQMELEIMKKLSHPNVISFEEHFDSSKKTFLVLELMGGGELLYQIQDSESTGKFYSEDNARSITSQLLKAMSYIHSNHVLHRDLKPENLMFKEKSTDATLKIIDFGLATILKKGEQSFEWCGTPDFQAPEMVKRKGYNFPVDMWAVGVIVYILLCGAPPFKDSNTMRLYSKIVKGAVEYPDSTWSSVSSEAKDFTKSLLTTDPETRLTADQALTHPWIKSQKKRRELPTPPPRPKEFSANLQKLNTERRFKKCGEALLQSQRYQIFQPAASVKPPDVGSFENSNSVK